jgi:hypothetical protein
MSRRDAQSEPSKTLPGRGSHVPGPTGQEASSPTVFVPAPPSPQRGRRWPWFLLGFLTVVAIAAVAVMVAWPRLRPRPRQLDQVERVAENYLKALADDDTAAARRLSTVDEPPAIRSAGNIRHDQRRSMLVKGPFASLGALHKKIESEYTYDSAARRFTPKDLLGPAGETLDALHAAKDEMEKSGLADKIKSGDPNDLFDAAEQYGKVFEKLASGVLAPRKILPNYKMLVESAKPPLPPNVKEFALDVAGAQAEWDALLKRTFHTLKADGPFIYERAVVNATATDKLASLGDPPSTLRLVLVRFRLEGIDTGWKVVAIRRVVPGVADPDDKPAGAAPKAPGDSKPLPVSPGESGRSLGDAPRPQ